MARRTARGGGACLMARMASTGARGFEQQLRIWPETAGWRQDVVVHVHDDVAVLMHHRWELVGPVPVKSLVMGTELNEFPPVPEERFLYREQLVRGHEQVHVGE